MLRRFELGFYGLIVIVAILYGMGTAKDDDPAARRPRSDHIRPPIPAVPPGGEVVNIRAERKTGNSVGTAYAISSDGLWLTAAHVVRDCDALALIIGPEKGERVKQVFIHPSYDLAVLETRSLGQRGLVPARIPPERGETGFHIGYPGGKPGDIVSRKMTTGHMHTRGYIERLEPIDIWAERARFPDSLTTLGGISGGPVFNANGEVVGSTVAGTVRRGRVYTAPVTSLRDMLSLAGKSWEGAAASQAGTLSLTESDIVAAGNDLRESRAVMQVYCAVR